MTCFIFVCQLDALRRYVLLLFYRDDTKMHPLVRLQFWSHSFVAIILRFTDLKWKYLLESNLWVK